MVKILYDCGHTQEWADGQAMVCPSCGETQRVRVTAPPPTFTGAVRGPRAIEKPVEPFRELFKGA